MKNILSVIRRRWPLLAAPALLGMLLGLLLGLVSGKTYDATARVFFNVSAGQSATDMNQAATYLEREMTSYQEVVTTPLVLQPAIDSLHLAATPEDLAKRVTTANQAGSTLMDVTVSSSSADESARTANAIADQMTKVTAQISPSPAGSGKAVNATVIQRATPPAAASGMGMAATALIGLVMGALIGVLLCGMVAARNRRFDSRDAELGGSRRAAATE